MWIMIGKLAGSCECRNEYLISIKCWEYVEDLIYYHLFKKGSSSVTYIELNCIRIYIYIYIYIYIRIHLQL
jgi:hypothetical protein